MANQYFNLRLYDTNEFSSSYEELQFSNRGNSLRIRILDYLSCVHSFLYFDELRFLLHHKK